MIPHSATEGLKQAPFKYAPDGFYAVIVNTRADKNENSIDYEWIQASFDEAQWWPRVADSWPQTERYLIVDIDKISGDPDNTGMVNYKPQSFVLRKSKYVGLGETENYNVLINPARELSNNMAVPVGSVVWMMPSYCRVQPDSGESAPGDPEEPPSYYYFFSYADHGPYEIGFTDDSVPGVLDDDDEPVSRYWTGGAFLQGDIFGSIKGGFRFFPASTPDESQRCVELLKQLKDNPDAKPSTPLPEICEVIRGGALGESASKFRYNRGIVVWKQFAFKDQDIHGNDLYYGRWEIQSTDCSTEFMAKLKPSGTSEKNELTPNTRKICELQWFNPESVEDTPMFHQKGRQWIYVDNQTKSTYVEDELFNIYYDRQANKYFCYSKATSPDSATKLRYGIVVEDGTAGPPENIDYGPLEFAAHECDSVGVPRDPEVLLKITTGAKYAKATSVFIDDVVAFLTSDPNTEEGTEPNPEVNFAVSDVWDDRMNTVKMWNGSQGDIPQGWTQWDTIEGRFPIGFKAGVFGSGDTGGDTEHTHDDHTHTSSAVGGVGAGAGCIWNDHVHNEADHMPPWLGVYFIIRSE